MPANTTFVAGAILTAAQMNNLPWGVVQATAGGTSGRGIVKLTSGSFTTTSATAADITGVSITFTPVTGRLYEASFFAGVNIGGGPAQVVIELTDAANNLVAWSIQDVIANGRSFMVVSNLFSGLSGSQTYKIRARTTTGVTTVFQATATNPMIFSIQDIGPSA